MKDLSENCVIESTAWLSGNTPAEVLEWSREVHRDDGSPTVQEDGCDDVFLSALVIRGWRIVIPSIKHNITLAIRRGMFIVPGHAFAIDLDRGEIFDTGSKRARLRESIFAIAIPPGGAQ